MFAELTETMIIAEIGVNHDGSLNKAKELISAARDCGASAVKFQSFKVESLVGENSPTPEYQLKQVQNSQYEILKKVEFSFSQQEELFAHAENIGIEIFATPFDLDSLSFLVNEMMVRVIKVSSGDIDNSPLLYSIGKTSLPTILSTGASELKDIDYALAVLNLGRQRESVPRDINTAINFSFDESSMGKMDCLLHCTSQYPAPFEDINLYSIPYLSKKYQIPIGLSDHSLGIDACVAAVALGAVVLEKHLTLNRFDKGPDHLASLDPVSFAQLVSSVRNVERAKGQASKCVMNSELQNRALIRRSVYAARDIEAGAIIEASDLVMLRPQVGNSHPHEYWELIGSTAARDFHKGENVRVS
jgi:sialic acid synthase SpsE